MRSHPIFSAGLCMLLHCGFSWAAAAPIRLESTVNQASLLELYTSEGCSSCPPAERWFSALKNNPELWLKLVPVAFHVDYWDSLGWKDPYASKSYTDRQHAYA